MGWEVSTFTLVILGGAVVALVVGLSVLRHRPDPMVWPLTVLMFAIAAWAIPHGISLGYTDVERVAFWHRIRYPGTVLAPIAYLVVALKYADYEQWLSRRAYASLAVVPVVTLVAVWTNPHHGLFWQSVSLARIGGASILVTEPGPWYWINLGYLYLLVVASLVLLAVEVIHTGPIRRKQAGSMFVGGLVPLSTNVAVNVGGRPSPMIDLTTTALAVSGLTFALALFHFDLLNLRPVARDRLVEELGDGVVVVGPKGRIRDFNPTARRIFADIAVNQPAEEVLPSNVVPDGGEIVVETAEGRQMFRSRSTELTDGRGRETGRIVYLNDVTEIVEREQRISILNRVLRHNIRNELNLTFGHLNALREQVSAADREHVDKAAESTRRLNQFAEKARTLERTFQESGTTIDVPVARAAERITADVRAEFPDADVEFDGPVDAEREEPLSARVVDEKLFETALAELVENAIVHNDHESPQATVGVESDSDRVRVTVADNGPGIPDIEKGVLTAEPETQLEHSSGLGLWLVKWTASLSSGSLSISETDSRGSVVTLSLPAAEE